MSQFFDAFTNAIISGSVIFNSRISPPALPAGNTDDYAPAGLASAAVLRITSNAAGSGLTGLQAQQVGFSILIENVSGGDLTIYANNAGSSAVNRFDIPADYIILLDDSRRFIYDDSLVWRFA